MTNIREATLRVWERRYGFPTSSRTDAGHRLYSQHDVFRLQWIKTRIDEGVQVRQAIHALQRAEKEGTFVSPSSRSGHFERSLESSMSLQDFQHRLLEALFVRDVDEASLVIGEAQALFPLEEIVLHLVGPTLRAIGEGWEQGQIDVATEHLATNHLRQFLLMWMRVGPPAYATNPVVLACAPEELHEGSLLMIGVLLRRLRWPVLYLGQTTPLTSLSMLIEDLQPAVVVFAALTEGPARALCEWPQWMPEVVENHHPLICFGGNAFVENDVLLHEMTGEYLGDSLPEALTKLDATLHRLNPSLY